MARCASGQYELYRKDVQTPLIIAHTSVADPGFDLRGGVDFVNGGGVENH